MQRAKRFIVVGAILAFVATIGGVALQGAWAQDTSTVQVTVSYGEPTLLAKGVAVSLPVTITCTGMATPEYLSASFYIRQVVQKQIVEGSAGTSTPADGTFACDGTPFTLTLTAYGYRYNSTGIFKKGLAVITVDGQVCGYTGAAGEYGGYTCRSASLTGQEVRIR